MRKWLPLVAICTGTFMLLIDVTIVNVALPDMALDLGTSFDQLQWVVDVYALALSAPPLGRGSAARYLSNLVRGCDQWRPSPSPAARRAYRSRPGC